ncbi:hypothetical protein ACP70R_037924 [Stipagrostis hirtigluma subsp. patula]
METICSGGGEPAVRKGPWTLEEDLILVSYVTQHGEGSWDSLARAAGLNRNGKSCRLRWLNYLRPGVRRGSITAEEDVLIRELHGRWGNKWSKIARNLPGRTDNEVKNYWRTRIQRKEPAAKAPQRSYSYAPPPTTTAAMDVSSEGVSSASSASRGSSAAAGRECWFMRHNPDQRCREANKAAASTVISEGASSSALTSQDGSTLGDGYMLSGYPCYPELGSVAAGHHLEMAGVDALTTQLFSSSELTESFWNVVDSFWETKPVTEIF